MAKYNKLIAAIVGLLLVILGPGFIGVSDGDTLFGLSAERVVELIIGALTAFGVWGVKNAPNDDSAS